MRFRQHWGKVLALSFIIGLLVGLWHLLDVQPRSVLAIPNPGDTVLSPGGRSIAVFFRKNMAEHSWMHYGPVRVFDLDTGQERFQLFQEKQELNGMEFSPDGRWLAVQDWLGHLTVWDAETGQNRATLSASPSNRTRFAFTTDGNFLAYDSDLMGLALWNMTSGERHALLEGAHSPVVFSPDGRTLATLAEGTAVALWNVADGRRLHTLVGHKDKPYFIVFSPNGKLLASGLCVEGAGDKEVPAPDIKLWDTASGQVQADLIVNAEVDSKSFCLFFSPDNRYLFGAFFSKGVGLWDVTTKQPRDCTLQAADGGSKLLNDPCFSPDGARLVVVPRPRTFQVLDATTLRTETVSEAQLTGVAPQFSSDARKVAITVPRRVEREPSSTQRALDWLSDWLSLGPTPKYRRSSNGSSVKVLELGTDRELAVLPGVSALRFHPDNHQLWTETWYTQDNSPSAEVTLALCCWDIPPRKPLGWFLTATAATVMLYVAGVWRYERRRKRQAARVLP